MFIKSHAMWRNIRVSRPRSHKKKATRALVIKRSQGLAARQDLSSVCMVSEASPVHKLSNHLNVVLSLGTAMLGLIGLSFCSLPPKGLSSRC